jgi:hypothetical protein
MISLSTVFFILAIDIASGISDQTEMSHSSSRKQLVIHIKAAAA